MEDVGKPLTATKCHGRGSPLAEELTNPSPTFVRNSMNALPSPNSCSSSPPPAKRPNALESMSSRTFFRAFTVFFCFQVPSIANIPLSFAEHRPNWITHRSALGVLLTAASRNRFLLLPRGSCGFAEFRVRSLEKFRQYSLLAHRFTSQEFFEETGNIFESLSEGVDVNAGNAGGPEARGVEVNLEKLLEQLQLTTTGPWGQPRYYIKKTPYYWYRHALQSREKTCAQNVPPYKGVG